MWSNWGKASNASRRNSFKPHPVSGVASASALARIPLASRALKLGTADDVAVDKVRPACDCALHTLLEVVGKGVEHLILFAIHQSYGSRNSLVIDLVSYNRSVWRVAEHLERRHACKQILIVGHPVDIRPECLLPAIARLRPAEPF